MFLRKQLLTVNDYLFYLKKHLDIEFQMDVIRNGLYNFQVFSNNLPCETKELFSGTYSYVIIFNLDSNIAGYEEIKKKLFISSFADKISTVIDTKNQKRYFIKIPKNYITLVDILKKVILECYCFEGLDYYTVQFIKFNKKGERKLISSDSRFW